MAKFWLQVLAFNLVFTTVNSQVFPVIVGLGGIALYQAAKCRIVECCTDKWVNQPNITGLQHDLKTRLFGQHLVTSVVFNVIKGHLNNKNPKKALALSFNGATGCGKSYVSRIIAENLFKKGIDSEYVKLIIVTHHFHHKGELEEYKKSLRGWILGNITKCARSLFIFDEMHEMPEGLVDVLEPFMEHYPKVEGVDCRKSMFIFLSNTGAKFINGEVLNNWRKGHDRSAITIKQMDKIINLGAFNEKGGFWHTKLIENHLIDYFVPFLPLERSHVKKCAEVDLKEKKHTVTVELLNKIADEYYYFPGDTKIFSTSGCKRISSKVDFVIGET